MHLLLLVLYLRVTSNLSFEKHSIVKKKREGMGKVMAQLSDIYNLKSCV